MNVLVFYHGRASTLKNDIYFGFYSGYIITILEIIRSLARYGPITIEAKHRQWKCGVLVRLPAGVREGYVSVYGDRLQITLQELLPIAEAELQHLWEEHRKPKQMAFNYGTGENGESHP